MTTIYGPWVRDDVIGRYLDRMFVHSFVEERFAASASWFRTMEYEIVKATGDVAWSYAEEYWIRPLPVPREGPWMEVRKMTVTELREYRPLVRLWRRLFG